MSKISKEAKKEEAVKRLEELTKTFNLRPNNILKYFKEDKLYYSYITCKGLLGTIDTINYDKRYAEVVGRFEEEYDCLVYHVIETGNTIALLFVSDNKEEWEFEHSAAVNMFLHMCATLTIPIIQNLGILL